MVFIGIAGLQYSGRHACVRILVEQFHFKYLALTNESSSCAALVPWKAFSSPESLIDFVLLHYTDHFVTILGTFDLEKEHTLYALRPFYITLAIDASAKRRYQRSLLRGGHGEGLSAFMDSEDSLPSTFFLKASVTIQNQEPEDTLESLQHKLQNVLSTAASLLRPTWDIYFMQLCILASQRSNCMKRRVGAVLVTSRSHRILATGYNGTPMGLSNCFEGGCHRCNVGSLVENGKGPSSHDLSTCICLHAEENALLEAGRERILKYSKGSQGILSESEASNFDSAILYCTTCPCIGCAKKIIQCGISEVVYRETYHYDSQVAALFKMAQVRCRQLESPCLSKKFFQVIKETTCEGRIQQ